MFTDKAQAIIDLAKDFAQTAGTKELDIASLVLAMIRHAEGAILLAECVRTTPEKLRAAMADAGEPSSMRGRR
jgi:ATP-dependent Clp protease ATP-binding subunit ClpA